MTSQEKPIVHGTLDGYHNRGCRCDECTEANRAYHRNYMRGNEHQRRLSVLRSTVHYWRTRVELLTMRREHDNDRYKADGHSVTHAQTKLRAAIKRYENERDSGGESSE